MPELEFRVLSLETRGEPSMWKVGVQVLLQAAHKLCLTLGSFKQLVFWVTKLCLNSRFVLVLTRGCEQFIQVIKTKLNRARRLFLHILHTPNYENYYLYKTLNIKRGVII